MHSNLAIRGDHFVSDKIALKSTKQQKNQMAIESKMTKMFLNKSIIENTKKITVSKMVRAF